MNYSTPETIAIVSGLTGAGIGAVAKQLTGNRRVDKVDAVAAISDAYKEVMSQQQKQIDSLRTDVAELRRDIVRKDGMLERLILQLAVVAPIAPIAPIAPVAPVAPVLPIAPLPHEGHV